MIAQLAAYLHRLDRFAIRFMDDGPAVFMGIRWYGLSYVAGFILGYLLIRRVARVGVSTLEPKNVSDFIWTLLWGVVIGGRLGYVLFYEPSLLWDPPLLGVFKVWEGGMSSHGGMIGAILACVYHARRHKHVIRYLTDLICFAAPAGLLLGRLANFVNGELWGRPCRPDLPWAVRFPQEITAWSADRLLNLYHQLPAELTSRMPIEPADIMVSEPVHLYFSNTVIDLVQRGSTQVTAVLEPLLLPRHPSQIYEALLEGLVLFVVLAVIWVRPRRPGILSSWFLILYGAMRILAEHFREPDIDIGLQWLGLTRGQWLSVLMVIVGAGLLIAFLRRAADPMGGWRAQSPPSLPARLAD